MDSVERLEKQSIIKSLQHFPCVALLGPRQVGKTTLAKQIGQLGNTLYLDLERPSDLAKLSDAESFLESHQMAEKYSLIKNAA